MDEQKPIEALTNLPEDADEPLVSSHFIFPTFLEALGFTNTEILPQYSTGQGRQTVDFALRHNHSNDIFINTKTNPFLLVELKGRNINLSEGSSQYKTTVNQLKKYLLDEKCKSAKWGLITNANHIQLFRKHGKVVHPVTQVIEITPETIVNITQSIRQKIAQPKRALTVAVYNNKGGVGKTTTTVNLAAFLASRYKTPEANVLVIDLDPDQGDLTKSLGIDQSQGSFYECLKTKNTDIGNAIQTQQYSLGNTRKTLTLDVLPIDTQLSPSKLNEDEFRKYVQPHRLKQILVSLSSKYEYIFIDTPPNWRSFTALSLYAADVVLIPTKHNNIHSIENAVTVLNHYIPEVQKTRKDGLPVPLPIFFNGEKITDSQRSLITQIIDNIIRNNKPLLPYLYPRFTPSNKNRHIFEVPVYARIANAAFLKVPAVCQYKVAYNYYAALAKEYFIQ
ncbi:MAG: AAA family ATPase [Spirulinaceae cyanobacterium]